jgi:hypothetical protein
MLARAIPAIKALRQGCAEQHTTSGPVRWYEGKDRTSAAALIASPDDPEPCVVIKVTPSVPKELYYLRASTHLLWGTRVVLPVPNDTQTLVYGHGWFPVGAPLHTPPHFLGSQAYLPCLLLQEPCMASCFLDLPFTRGMSVHPDSSSILAITRTEPAYLHTGVKRKGRY